MLTPCRTLRQKQAAPPRERQSHSKTYDCNVRWNSIGRPFNRKCNIGTILIIKMASNNTIELHDERCTYPVQVSRSPIVVPARPMIYPNKELKPTNVG